MVVEPEDVARWVPNHALMVALAFEADPCRSQSGFRSPVIRHVKDDGGVGALRAKGHERGFLVSVQGKRKASGVEFGPYRVDLAKDSETEEVSIERQRGVHVPDGQDDVAHSLDQAAHEPRKRCQGLNIPSALRPAPAGT